MSQVPIQSKNPGSKSWSNVVLGAGLIGWSWLPTQGSRLSLGETVCVPVQESCLSVMSSKSWWVPVHCPNRLVLAETRVLSVGAGCGSAVKLVARTGRNSRSLSLDQSVRQPLPPPSPPSPPPFLFPPTSTISFSTKKQLSNKKIGCERRQRNPIDNTGY